MLFFSQGSTELPAIAESYLEATNVEIGATNRAELTLPRFAFVVGTISHPYKARQFWHAPKITGQDLFPVLDRLSALMSCSFGVIDPHQIIET